MSDTKPPFALPVEVVLPTEEGRRIELVDTRGVLLAEFMRGDEHYADFIAQAINSHGSPAATPESRPLGQWSEANDEYAHRLAWRIVQDMADSEPDDDTIEAQELLEGTPQASICCLTSAALQSAIFCGISNAFFDREIARVEPVGRAPLPTEEAPPTLASFWGAVPNHPGRPTEPETREPAAEALAKKLEGVADDPEDRTVIANYRRLLREAAAAPVPPSRRGDDPQPA